MAWSRYCVKLIKMLLVEGCSTLCKFDPFGKDQYRYTFRKMCDEVAGLELGDEAYHVFFNTSGREGEISDRLKELLKYMDSTKAYPVERPQYDLIQKIDAAVGETKMGG